MFEARVPAITELRVMKRPRVADNWQLREENTQAVSGTMLESAEEKDALRQRRRYMNDGNAVMDYMWKLCFTAKSCMSIFSIKFTFSMGRFSAKGSPSRFTQICL
ncbi:hypothetical protein AMATHDRAFT_50345 [Amanita thiersii Skay4041]|uniref:Uncharacterized protein n=1 Tax=Amanita thiersii Skay4041 TaxID=703135 RepID=A0A2A9N9V6_9AGAR|nr:hypothetical protein AMATHDRAFT_50345 [Amanita thiersii Skay4041]